MSQIPVPPPIPSTPAPAPKKKGLPVLAWIGIGCGALLVIAVAIVIAGGFFVARTVSKASKDPVMAAAKLIVAANPDLELVSTDKTAGTITIRNKKTGEVVTVDLSDIKEGKIDFTGPKGEKMSVDAHAEGEGGTLSIHSAQGDLTFGGGTEAKTPDWVPSYPGASPEGTYSMTEEGKSAGGYQFKTPDSPQTVMDHYEEACKAAGFEVNKQTYSGGGTTGGVVDAKSGGKHCTISVASGDDGTTVMINFTEETPGE